MCIRDSEYMDNAKIEYLKANGVNTEIGIQNTSDVETYNEILLDFCNSFPQEMQKVNAYRQNNDINNYTILAVSYTHLIIHH